MRSLLRGINCIVEQRGRLAGLHVKHFSLRNKMFPESADARQERVHVDHSDLSTKSGNDFRASGLPDVMRCTTCNI